MAGEEGVFFVPQMSNDPRVRVFRRTLTELEDFSGMEVDAYAIITQRYVVILDTMLCPEDAAAMTQMVQNESAGRILLVVNSHVDWDHFWGNGYFTAEHVAPIIAHKHALTRLQKDEAIIRKDLADYQARYAVFRSVTLVPPTITFTHRLTIDGGDLTIELLPAPGHHLDHIAAWIPQLRLLLAFDAVERPLPIIEDATAVPLMYDTLERLIALQPERVLCSHGKTTSPQLVKDNLAYLHEVERRCQALLSGHRPSDAEIEQGATLIGYPFEVVVPVGTEDVDRKFYTWAHDNNVKCVMRWVITQQSSG
jgi:glyoxylase-like metal-dependent hydrolase (beta-lactamase superfamily II)